MFKYLTNVCDALRQPIHTILHVGAGKCAELPYYQQLRAQKIVLIEAHSELVSHLKSKTDSLPNIEVIQATAVADEIASFHETNNPRYSSVRALGAEIKAAFPNLKSKLVPAHHTRNIGSLVDDQHLTEHSNILLLEALGSNTTLVNQLTPGQLNKFRYVCITTSLKPLYENGDHTLELVELMLQKGFELQFNDNTYKPFERLYFRNQSLKASRIEQLEAENASYKTQCEELIAQQQDLASQTRELESERNNLAVRILQQQSEAGEELSKAQNEKLKLEAEKADLASRIAKLETERNDFAARIPQLESEFSEKLNKAQNEKLKLEAEKADLASRISKLETERNDFAARIPQLESEFSEKLNKAQNEKQVLEAEKADLGSRISVLESELSSRTKERDEQQHWHQENKKWAQSLRQQLETLKGEAKEKERSVSLGQKMLAKAQSDLDHLRGLVRGKGGIRKRAGRACSRA